MPTDSTAAFTAEDVLNLPLPDGGDCDLKTCSRREAIALNHRP